MKSRHLKAILRLFALVFVALVSVNIGAATLTVFAAASLTESLKENATNYEQQSGDKVVFNFAASGPLARQIEEGAPADIFFSADEARADALEEKGLLVKETRRSRLGNTLVIVATPDNATVRSPADLTNAAVGRVALGDVKTVPAGAYAKAWLEKLQLWPAVEPKVVPCESVRAVLAAVESGNVDAGIVYRTDAAISKKVKVAFAVPRDDSPAISYPMALVKDAPQAAAARKFLDYLAGEDAGKVFQRAGFILLPTEAKP